MDEEHDDWEDGSGDSDCYFCGEEHIQCCDGCGEWLCDSCGTDTPLGTYCPDCVNS